METSKTGGKSKGRGGYGRGGGRGRGRGRGSGRSGSKGIGSKGACFDDASPCTIKPTLSGHGKKTNATTEAQVVPLAYAAAAMEENLRIAHGNIDWMRKVLLGIDIKLLEKVRNSADMCVPRAAVDDVNNVIAIHKGIQARINNIATQVKQMSNALHVDAVSFRDGHNKKIETSDGERLTSLLMEGHLYFGGTPLQALLYIENENFRDRIYREHKAIPQASFSRLTYGVDDHHFAASYETDAGYFDVVFEVGLDGRAVLPRVERGGTVARDIELLGMYNAEEFAKRAADAFTELPKSEQHRSLRSLSRARAFI